jgi:hypothetical protein
MSVDKKIRLGIEIETCLDTSKLSRLKGFIKRDCSTTHKVAQSDCLKLDLFDSTEDSSIKCDGLGVEFISKTIELKQWPKIMDQINTIVKYSKECNKVSVDDSDTSDDEQTRKNMQNSCSTHIHMSCEGLNMRDHPDFDKVFLFHWINKYEPEFIETFYGERKNNKYCIPNVGCQEMYGIEGIGTAKNVMLNTSPSYDVARYGKEFYCDSADWHFEFRGYGQLLKDNIDIFNCYVKSLVKLWKKIMGEYFKIIGTLDVDGEYEIHSAMYESKFILKTLKIANINDKMEVVSAIVFDRKMGYRYLNKTKVEELQKNGFLTSYE